MTPRDPTDDVPNLHCDAEHAELVRDLDLHHAAVAGLGGLLDLDAGLDDIVGRAHHDGLVRDATAVLDIPSGLADIIAADPAAMPPFAREYHDIGVADRRTGLLGEENATSTPLAALFRSSVSTGRPGFVGTVRDSSGDTDGARLRVRTHPEFDRFLETLRLLEEVSPSATHQAEVLWLDEVGEYSEFTSNAGVLSCSAPRSDLMARLLDWIESWYPASRIGGVPEERLRSSVADGKHAGIRSALKKQAEALGHEVLDMRFTVDSDAASCVIVPPHVSGLTFILSPMTNALSVATHQLLDVLDAMTLDFTDADLSATDLTGLNLEGVRWSSRTRWPADWKDLIAEHSEGLGPDLYEVRHPGMLHGARSW